MMLHLIIAYARSKGRVVAREDVMSDGLTIPAVAWDARDRLVRKYALDPDVEVTLLGAESEATVRATHGRYFEVTR